MTVGQVPFWVEVAQSVDEDPPECRPEQMKLDECLKVALQLSIAKKAKEEEEEDDEAAFLDELGEREARELEEEAAFLNSIDDSDDDCDLSSSSPTDSDPCEPRSQVVYEHLASVSKMTARFAS